MKLSEAFDDMSRRRFLKTTAAGPLAASGLDKLKLGAAAGAAGGAVAPTTAALRGVLWYLVDHIGQSRYLDMHADQVAEVAKAAGVTPDAMADYVRKVFTGAAPDIVPNVLAVINDAGALDKYTGGAYLEGLKDFVAKHGPRQTVKMTCDHAKSLGADVPYNAIAKLGEVIPAIGKIFPPKIFKGALEDPREALKILERNQAIDREQARDEIEHVRRHERRQPRVERIKPRPDDYVYGSPMHQPFESRLSIALGTVT